MIVKVSKTMVKFLKENSKFKSIYDFSYEEIDPTRYQWYVDSDLLNNEIDWNDKTGKMKYIRIKYPDEYYACPKCITTRNLNNCIKEFKGKLSAEDFITAFDSMIEI